MLAARSSASSPSGGHAGTGTDRSPVESGDDTGGPADHSGAAVGGVGGAGTGAVSRASGSNQHGLATGRCGCCTPTRPDGRSGSPTWSGRCARSRRPMPAPPGCWATSTAPPGSPPARPTVSPRLPGGCGHLHPSADDRAVRGDRTTCDRHGPVARAGRGGLLRPHHAAPERGDQHRYPGSHRPPAGPAARPGVPPEVPPAGLEHTVGLLAETTPVGFIELPTGRSEVEVFPVLR